jgi:hypothetical protein
VLLATGVLLAGLGGALLLPRTAAQSDVGPAVAPDAPQVAFLGDSWTRGAGATDLRGYAPRTAAELGWRHREHGVGGSGYSVPGPHASTFGDRVDAAATSGADRLAPILRQALAVGRSGAPSTASVTVRG